MTSLRHAVAAKVLLLGKRFSRLATVPCGRLSIRAHVKIASRIVSYRVAQRKTWPDLILDLTK